MEQEQKPREEGQIIYLVKVKVAYKIKRGNGYINNYREMNFPTRVKSIQDMNGNPDMIMRLMGSLGLKGKKVYDFYVMEELYRKEISKSFAHKEEDYEREFGEQE